MCVGDHLEISVWPQPELSKIVVVDRDGIIKLPSLNVVKVSWLSVQAVADVLTRSLESTFPKSRVTVGVS